MTETQKKICEYFIIKGMGWKFIMRELGITKWELERYRKNFQVSMNQQRKAWLERNGWSWQWRDS